MVRRTTRRLRTYSGPRKLFRPRSQPRWARRIALPSIPADVKKARWLRLCLAPPAAQRSRAASLSAGCPGVTKVLLEPPMAMTTTLKLPSALRTRVARVARKTGRTPHRVMLEAIERETARQERMEAFVKEALTADREIEESGEVYAARDVHAWLQRLAGGRKASLPKPWRR